jgi:hypothetical protein
MEDDSGKSFEGAQRGPNLAIGQHYQNADAAAHEKKYRLGSTPASAKMGIHLCSGGQFFAPCHIKIGI